MTTTQKQASLCVFEYQPLSEHCKEIRVLTVYKAVNGSHAEGCGLEHALSDGASVVCCTIEHVSLIQPRYYKGLSYCWGNIENTRIIHVNGYEMQVTENLEAALRGMGRHESVCLWVDALCINQSDLDEQGRQVLRMEDIYKCASETICRLGSEAEDSCLASDLIQVLSRNNQ